MTPRVPYAIIRRQLKSPAATSGVAPAHGRLHEEERPMRRLITFALSLGLVSSVLMAGVASADTDRGSGCIMQDDAGAMVYVPDAQYRVTINSFQGNGVLVCVGDTGSIGESSTAPLVGLYADDLCFAKGQSTDVIWSNTSASGVTTLVCQFNYSKP
jgi:hypothetical protein